MLRNLAICYAISAIVILLGVLLPWASLLGISVNGSSTDDGKLAFILVGVIAFAAFLAYLGQDIWSRILGLLGSALALILAIYEIQHLSSKSFRGMHADVGAGLWIMIVGSCFGMLATFFASHRRITV